MIESLLQDMIKVGDVTLHLPGGAVHRVGDGAGEPIVVRLTTRGLRRIVAQPTLGLGEAYMEGDLTFDQGTLWELLEVVGRSGGRTPKGRGSRLKRLKR